MASYRICHIAHTPMWTTRRWGFRLLVWGVLMNAGGWTRAIRSAADVLLGLLGIAALLFGWLFISFLALFGWGLILRAEFSEPVTDFSWGLLLAGWLLCCIVFTRLVLGIKPVLLIDKPGKKPQEVA